MVDTMFYLVARRRTFSIRDTADNTAFLSDNIAGNIAFV